MVLSYLTRMSDTMNLSTGSLEMRVANGKLKQETPVRHHSTENAVVSATRCRTYGEYMISAQKAKRRC
ncbi:hypothetical protein PR202_gb27808 [Eleusine coracana subsp. coracana]|uniref:Uncharacterized protein n=1 Tax=Eleusine coracana subsp. coracana TaxID=191504 RepID=A0AAV5FSX1_ELECO|nr:hypothetical protein PR202_gb27808 [Eleusine coracana subsp. coracana]